MDIDRNLFDLTGRTALVTGGGYGLGRALVRGLAGHGARVLSVARSADGLAETFSTLGPEHRYIVGDLTDDALYAELDSAPEDIDILVNNIGGSLDSVVVDLARVRSLDPEDVKFPFAPDRQKLADILDVDFRRIDEDLADYLYRLAPCKGGNHELWLLHALDLGEAAAPALPALEELFRSVTDTVQALGDWFGRRA